MKIKGLEKVLLLVNKAREAEGLNPLTDLPVGIKQDGEQCPIARALEKCTRADSDYITFDDEMLAENIADVWNAGISKLSAFRRFQVATPSDMAFFIDDFDNDAYPEYEQPVSYEGEI